MTAELDDVVRDIGKCQDVVDLVVVLLRICRKHSQAVQEAHQDWRKRALLRDERARLQEQATKTFTSVGLSEGTKQLAIATLGDGSDLAVKARALALGIGAAVQSRDPTAYGQWRRCNWPIGELKDGDAYPTPSADLSVMYGGSSGLSSRPGTNAGSAFDRVEGLALWRSGSVRVIYDTVAGVRLDNALGRTVDILAVTPNEKISGELWFKKLTTQSFFGAYLLKPRLQNKIVQAALRNAIDLKADIVVTPELSSTTTTVEWLKRSTAGGQPQIVIAGGSHLTIKGKRRNRLSTIYTGPKPLVVNHDKIGDYQFCFEVVENGKKKRYELDEAIDRSRQLRIHAGLTWSMIPLICADFLDPDVVNAVAGLCPRLVMVPSMTIKTGDFVKNMGPVIRQSQSTVVVANGPHNWGDATPPVAVIGMPLEDAKKWIIEEEPRPSDKPPYQVLFSSRRRATEFFREFDGQ
jgi:hypothetical protein